MNATRSPGLVPTTTSSNIAVWQRDDEVSDCPICHEKFSFFYRRHHCRMCGRVVCSKCSENFCSYLPTTYVVSPPSQIYLQSPIVPHRTCQDCYEELKMIRNALERRSSASSISGASASTIDLSRQTMVQSVSHTQESDLNRCPVCESLLVHLPQAEQEMHIDHCLRNYGSSPEHNSHPYRMIISRLPQTKEGEGSKSMAAGLGECTVCFEEFEPGQSVGRMECLCIFHEKCILTWFKRKGMGNCPVHNQ